MNRVGKCLGYNSVKLPVVDYCNYKILMYWVDVLYCFLLRFGLASANR